MQRVADGEVSSYLADELRSGDTVEVRGPVGGWFVWKPGDSAPVLLVAGGSGVVPLMAMIRSRDGASPTPFRLIYSVRTPEDRIYDHELRRRATEDSGLEITFLYTRRAPDGRNAIGRADSRRGSPRHGWPPDLEPTCYVCGPTPFVETVADLLVGLGHDPTRSGQSGSGRVAHDGGEL